MKKIYENRSFVKVGHYRSILEGEGIATLLKNEASCDAFETLGSLSNPELWVVNDEEYERALEILRPFYESETG